MRVILVVAATRNGSRQSQPSGRESRANCDGHDLRSGRYSCRDYIGDVAPLNRGLHLGTAPSSSPAMPGTPYVRMKPASPHFVWTSPATLAGRRVHDPVKYHARQTHNSAHRTARGAH